MAFLRFFTMSHLRVMWPFMLGGGYIYMKFWEMFQPSALSEQDKRDSKYLKQLKSRGIFNPTYPEYTAITAKDDHHHGHH